MQSQSLQASINQIFRLTVIATDLFQLCYHSALICGGLKELPAVRDMWRSPQSKTGRFCFLIVWFAFLTSAYRLWCYQRTLDMCWSLKIVWKYKMFLSIYHGIKSPSSLFETSSTVRVSKCFLGWIMKQNDLNKTFTYECQYIQLSFSDAIY